MNTIKNIIDPGKLRSIQRVTTPDGFFLICALDHLSDFQELLDPDPKTVDYFLTNVQGHVLPGELWGKNVEVLRINLPKGLSYLELSVKAKESDPTGLSFPELAE